MPFLQHGEASIWYEEHGAGDPVLLFAPGFLRSRLDRWRGNPDRPEQVPPVEDPMRVLADGWRVVAMDQRNAGRSRAPIRAGDGWHSYAEDHLALLDQLSIRRCHIIGACIGVSFALALALRAPERVGALVLQNPIGLAGNAPVLRRLFETWAAGQQGETEPLWPAMFGGDFVFSVTREQVAGIRHPALLLPGDDQEHPAETSAELARLLPDVQVATPWKGLAHHAGITARLRGFLAAHPL